MSTINHISSAEQMAQRWFARFNDHKMLFGFGAMLLLTLCSIYFNFRLGRLNSTASDLTWYVMPLSYSFLDVALLCIGMALFARIITGVLSLISWVWFTFLLSLSLWACLSCIIALDAQKAASGDEFKRQQLEIALNQANKNVSTWQTNFERTDRHKSRFQDRLDNAVAQRDELIEQISKLDSSTPPAQVIFHKFESLLPAWMSPDMFKTLARLVFGVAMVCTPLVLAAILAQVLGSHSPQPRRLQPQPENHQNSDFAEGNRGTWGKQASPLGTVAQNAEIPHESREVTEVVELDREALNKVRDWLRTQEGRVSRRSIEHRAGTRKYAQISLIIEALLQEGWLVRMANKQLTSARPELKAVG